MNKNNTLEDVNLWEQVISNDCHESFNSLFRKYYKPLLNYGLHLVPRKQLVKDSIQELFITVWDTRKRLSEVDNVSSYLYTSFRRTLFRQVEILSTWKKRDQKYFNENYIESSLNIEQLLIVDEIKKEVKKGLYKTFENLNGCQKEVVFLKFYSGFSNDEISEIMNVKKESVYNYLYRAICMLKKNINISVTA